MVESKVPDQLPGLDCSGGLDRASDDFGFYLSLWEQYEARYHNLLSQFTNLFNTGDIDQLHNYAHGVKGVCATLGAVGVQAIASEIEQLITIPDDHGVFFLNQLQQEQNKLAESLIILEKIAATHQSRVVINDLINPSVDD